MSLFLDVEVSGGTSIEEAAQDAIDLANRIDITVLFRFNGVRCMACPGDDPRLLVDRWSRLLVNSQTLGIARGQPQAKDAEAQ